MALPTRRYRLSLLQHRIPLLLAYLLLLLAVNPTIATHSSSRTTEDEPRGSRSAKKTFHNSIGRKGPRGSVLPRSARHRLQENMGVVPLSNGYGGVGGPSMTVSIPDMRDQIVPVVPTVTPASPSPTPDNRNITYLPGALTVMEGDLILSQGLTSRVFAQSGEPVLYADGTSSVIDFHDWPDGASCFPDNRAGNTGGWIYVSNMEDKPGGVGAITFDSEGRVIDYKMLLEGTTYNCNGGSTPWDTWITAEEDFDKESGRPWQVDPYGIRPPEAINMGNRGGSYEAFAYDVRSTDRPRFFLTEDSVFGALEMFTPTAPNWMDPWTILMGMGVHQWLILTPSPNNNTYGTYSWTTDIEMARTNAAEHYPESEGIDVTGSNLFFVCKGIKMLFTLDLDGNTYTRHSTDVGLFEGEPDMIRKVLTDEDAGESMLYFTEDNGRRAGLHARNQNGELLTILEGFFEPETTGLALSPDGRFMYICFQEDGYCFEISRVDGLSFRARTMNVKRHATEGGTRKETRKAYRERKFV